MSIRDDQFGVDAYRKDVSVEQILALKEAVVEAAMRWAETFHGRAETLIEDDELYFKVLPLLAARQQVEGK